MNKLLLILTMAIMMPVALALDFNYATNPSTVVAGQEYTLTLTVSDPAGIESIEDVPRVTGIMPCGGDTSCIKTFPFVAGTSSSESRTFSIRLSNNQYIEKTAIVAVTTPSTTQGATTSASHPSSSSSSSSGANNPTTATVTVVGDASPGKEFFLVINARDADGIESIEDEPRVSGVMPCGGDASCDKQFPRTEASAGIRTYIFNIRDSSNNIEKITHTIGVGVPLSPASGASSSGGGGSSGPSASFTINPENPALLQTVTFDASKSRGSSGGTVKSYEWDFNNDGQNEISTPSPTTTWIFNEEKGYKVRLTVTDSNGMTSYGFGDVTVSGVLPATGSVAPNNLATIIVTIMDLNDPVDGANVQLTPRDDPSATAHATMTESDGVATFNDVVPMCYIISANKDGKAYGEEEICVASGELAQRTIGAREASVGLGSTWLYVLAAIIVIGLIGGGAWYYMNYETANKTPQNPKPVSTTSGPILSSQTRQQK